MSYKQFLHGYLECLFWVATTPDGEPLSNDYTVLSIAPEAMAWIDRDCRAFFEANAERWGSEIDDSQAGHDFCLTRNGHGAGFWDRGLGALGDQLTKACRPYCEQDLYVGDDDQLYV